MKKAFEDLDKDIVISESKTPLKEFNGEIKTDWAKLAKAVLTMLKPHISAAQYNLFNILAGLLTRKPSKLNMFISITLIGTVQVCGVIGLVKIVLNIVHLIVTKIYPI